MKIDTYKEMIRLIREADQAIDIAHDFARMNGFPIPDLNRPNPNATTMEDEWESSDWEGSDY